MLTWWLEVPRAAGKSKLPHSSTFQASACITFANVPLGKASVRPPFKGWRNRLHLLLGGAAVTLQMDEHTGIGRIYGQFCNLPQKGRARTFFGWQGRQRCSSIEFEFEALTLN